LSQLLDVLIDGAGFNPDSSADVHGAQGRAVLQQQIDGAPANPEPLSNFGYA